MSQEEKSFGIYAEKASNLVVLVNKLRDVGAQYELDLPTIVVSGNQSVGKSSIMELICGIPLPRSEGTCTRCVIEVRMQSLPETNCFVKLRKEFSADHLPLKKVVEIPFHQQKSKRGLDTVIKHAQTLLLNPSKELENRKVNNKTLFESISHKLQEILPENNELMFTQNVICVDIQGEDIDLTLIDLPGIIQSVGLNQDKTMIGMIERLVKSYIKKERSLILAVITCKDEIENQAIFHMAREVDPSGIRTIG
jgi:GTP-binding protein EngB required for normal cell division